MSTLWLCFVDRIQGFVSVHVTVSNPLVYDVVIIIIMYIVIIIIVTI